MNPYFLKGKTEDECVLLIHGFTGCPGTMRPLGEYLNGNGEGFNVRAMLLPGHGTVKEDLLDVKWKDWYQSAAREYKELRKEFSKVYVVGLSLGGNIALSLAASFDVGKIITISAPIIIKSKLIYIVGFLSHFRKYTYWRNSAALPGEIDLNRGYDGMPLKSIAEVRKITIASYRRLRRVRQPILIAQSLRDRIVHPRSPYIIYNRVGSAYKELLFLENSRHNAVLGVDHKVLFESVDKFLRKSIS